MDEKTRKAADRAQKRKLGLVSTSVWVPQGHRHIIQEIGGCLRDGKPFSWTPESPGTLGAPAAPAKTLASRPPAAAPVASPLKWYSKYEWLDWALMAAVALVAYAVFGASLR